MQNDAPLKPGHGDHWLAALSEGDPRLVDALAAPIDAPDGLRLHRQPLTTALDMVQVTLRRRLVTAYPEPRATTLLHVRPVEMGLWDTRVEGWLTVDHDDAGSLVLFLTDLAENAHRYGAATPAGIDLEAAGLAYLAAPVALPRQGKPRLAPARGHDTRFLPDDYWFEGEVRDIQPVGDGEVVHLGFQGSLELPVVLQTPTGAAPGDHLQGYLWLTGRLPTDHGVPR